VELLAGPDFDAEEAGRRIEGERDRLREEIGRLDKKLGNAKFVERAPADVVEGERGKLAEYTAALQRL
jgi:valyl-tRNA synthetase